VPEICSREAARDHAAQVHPRFQEHYPQSLPCGRVRSHDPGRGGPVDYKIVRRTRGWLGRKSRSRIAE
jgi:hypothetical protein